ncbi:MAG: hypothetical protein ACO3FI_02395 [Cyclobacteriaceae bacterium]
MVFSQKIMIFHAVLLFTAFGSRSQTPQIGTEQKNQGTQSGLIIVESFDGLGEGFEGPQGKTYFRNPSDNSLAVGPDHVVQIVNSRMAVFSKKGQKFSKTGEVLYGPGETRNVFKGFGGPCEDINNGDAVVRYDQFAGRWLIVMPTFRRAIPKHDTLPFTKYAGGAEAGKPVDPGPPAILYGPGYVIEERPAQRKKLPPDTVGSYCMCYAVSTSSDPLGSYYRYEFRRDRFPDYPRPAIWHNGYYTTTSTGDHLNERHAYVVDRDKMLKGLPASEQWFILPDVNFIIHADVDGKNMPDKSMPAIMLATGGDQLNKITKDDGIYYWRHYTDWDTPALSRLEGPEKISVPEYRYLGDGQLTKAIPQPGTEMKLDAQGDKLMARVVYRKFKNKEQIVAVHSVSASEGKGGIRWYEFLRTQEGRLNINDQGTYAPESGFRWMASPAIDKSGNIFIGYSFGDAENFPGQRMAARSANLKGQGLNFKEVILAEGEASQSTTLRWEDYTQTAVDPSDEDIIWYVGDYLKKGNQDYSTRIAAVKIETRSKSGKK